MLDNRIYKIACTDFISILKLITMEILKIIRYVPSRDVLETGIDSDSTVNTREFKIILKTYKLRLWALFLHLDQTRFSQTRRTRASVFWTQHISMYNVYPQKIERPLTSFSAKETLESGT